MIFKIYQYIRGYVRIRITGYRTERFLNACSYKKIRVWDLRACKNSYEMNLWVKDFKKLRHISHKTSTKITIIGKYGLPFYLFRHRNRKLFFCGIFSAFLMLAIMSGFVWDIEILGTHTRTEEVIRKFLKEKHVNTGMRRSDIDCERIVKDIRKEYDDIIWVSASVDGTKLIIHIKENEDVTFENENDPVNTDSPPDNGTDLISDCDGTIIRIITRKGVPQVTEGDCVTSGELLVSGQVPIQNDAKEIIGYRPCNSDADIFIQTQIPYNFTMPRKHLEKKSIRRPSLFSFSFRIGKYRLTPPLLWKPYKHYTISSRETQIRLLDHFYLPVFITSSRQTPYRPVERKYTDEQLCDILNRYFLRYCEDLDKKGVEIIQNDVKIDTGSTEGIMSGALTVVKKTGQIRQSEIPSLPEGQEEQNEQLGE